MNKRHDYNALEREFVRGDMSLRELARMHNITNHSLVQFQAKRNDWMRKREEFREKADERAIVYMADAEGLRRAREDKVRSNAIEAIDEAITKMRADMAATRKVLRGAELVEEPLVIITPKDLAILIDRLNVLFGRPANITEERNLGINISGAAGPDILRGIVEATRGIGPLAGDASGSPIPRIDRTREN